MRFYRTYTSLRRSAHGILASLRIAMQHHMKVRR